MMIESRLLSCEENKKLLDNKILISKFPILNKTSTLVKKIMKIAIMLLRE